MTTELHTKSMTSKKPIKFIITNESSKDSIVEKMSNQNWYFYLVRPEPRTEDTNLDLTIFDDCSKKLQAENSWIDAYERHQLQIPSNLTLDIDLWFHAKAFEYFAGSRKTFAMNMNSEQLPIFMMPKDNKPVENDGKIYDIYKDIINANRKQITFKMKTGDLLPVCYFLSLVFLCEECDILAANFKSIFRTPGQDYHFLNVLLLSGSRATILDGCLRDFADGNESLRGWFGNIEKYNTEFFKVARVVQKK